MPDIRLQYRSSGYRGVLYDWQVEALVSLLRQACAKRFSVPELELSADDFDVYVEPLHKLSTQKQDVTIRIVLHNFPERVAAADRHAAEVAEEVRLQLRAGAHDSYHRTVGVSLVFGEIAWATASAPMVPVD